MEYSVDQLVQGRWPAQVLAVRERNLRRLCASEGALMRPKNKQEVKGGEGGSGVRG